MSVEIERKYLVHKDKWHKADKGSRKFYRQGYMLTDPSRTIRVRLTDSHGFITIKGKSVGASRLEYEYEIPMQDAKELLDNFCSSIISKYRYEVYEGGKLWEVDEFLEDNEGLIVAEVELFDEGENIQLPDWTGTEVTGEQRYYNSNLSIHPFKNWPD